MVVVSWGIVGETQLLFFYVEGMGRFIWGIWFHCLIFLKFYSMELLWIGFLRYIRDDRGTLLDFVPLLLVSSRDSNCTLLRNIWRHKCVLWFFHDSKFHSVNAFDKCALRHLIFYLIIFFIRILLIFNFLVRVIILGTIVHLEVNITHVYGVSIREFYHLIFNYHWWDVFVIFIDLVHLLSLAIEKFILLSSQ
jgi:hypothetical protein